MGNQVAAKVLEATFHVSNMDLSNPDTFIDQANGWKLVVLLTALFVLTCCGTSVLLCCAA